MTNDESSGNDESPCEHSAEDVCEVESELDSEVDSEVDSELDSEVDSELQHEDECDEDHDASWSLHGRNRTTVFHDAHSFAAGKTLADVSVQREIPAWQGKLLFGAVILVIVAIGTAIVMTGS